MRLNVTIADQLMGQVVQDPTGNVKFAYAPEYLRLQDPTPLSLSMPLATITYRKNRILPFLAGLLPESENALAAIAKRSGANPRNPVALLRHIGLDVAEVKSAIRKAVRGTL